MTTEPATVPTPRRPATGASGTGRPTGRLTGRLAGRWVHLVAVLVFVATSFIAVATVMSHYKYPSPIDEVVHFDYIHDVPHVPVNGERISQQGLDEWACRTSGPEYVLPLPACTHRHYNPDEFPGQGYSTAGSTPPVYYVVTAVIARPITKVTGWDLFDVARGVGALWLAGFMTVSYLVALRLRVAPVTAAAATVVLGMEPHVISSAATMGPDTATALTSGLVLMTALAFDGTRRRVLWFLAAVALAALTKFTAFTAIGVAIIFLVLRPLLDRDRRGPGFRPSLLAAVGAMGVFGAISLVWGVRFQSTSLIDPDLIPINVMLHADSVPWGSVSEFLAYLFFSPATNNWQPLFLNDATNSYLVTAIAGLFCFTTVAAALTLRQRPRVSALGVGLLLMTIVSPFLLVALNFYANHLYFQLSPRYGYALLPGIVAITAWVLRGVGASRALVLLAVLSVVNVLT